jgi:hypothetical protein
MPARAKEPSMFVSSRYCRRALLVGTLALATVWSSAAQVRAQGDRITLPRRPSPSQTLTVHMTQDMDLQMSMGAATPPPSAPGADNQAQPQSRPPMKLTGMMMVEGTQKFGDLDDQGRTPCEFTYTDASMDMKMNGMSVPSQNFKDQFVGKSMSFAYGSDGAVTAVKLADMPGAAGIQSSVQQALSAFTMSIPTQPLAIGDTAKMPFSMPLAMPLPGGATPPAFKGTITYTLVRVEGSGANRVAVLDQKLDATASGPLPAPPGQPTGTGANLTMHMTGTGQVQMDLTRGVARSGEMTTTMDGSIMRSAPAAGQDPSAQSQSGMPGDVRIQGSTKMKMSSDPADRDK